MIPIAKPLIGEEEKQAVQAVLSSGVIAQGPRVKEFEGEFSKYCDASYGVAASSGTTALHLALLACGVKPGDEVITTPFSFIATANSILYCRAKPVFADIDPETFNIGPDEIEAHITDKTRAVLVVHLYGQPCEMDSLTRICGDNDIRLIEDACQAHGAECKGRKAGSLGDCAVFSFYPTKNMTTGEGGMLTTDDSEIADRARLLREHGSKVRYHHDVLGYNYRMTDIAAAIGLEQLKKLDSFNTARKGNAERLTEALKGVEGIEAPIVRGDVKHVFHQYTIRVTSDFHRTRDEVVQRLKESGIGTGIY
ncbi:MAG: DegT/DnrJ/EryC1/StrS family aminotransferase, partial [Candidatus Hydrothermarchaeales archaeon]